jgi:hypothetical protein
MLRRMRTAPAVRLMLCVATLLAVGASFGLHPEPGDASAPRTTAIEKTAAPQTIHGCVACLNHGAALSSPFSGLFLASSVWEPAALPFGLLWYGRLGGTGLPGRSPPFGRS